MKSLRTMLIASAIVAGLTSASTTLAGGGGGGGCHAEGRTAGSGHEVQMEKSCFGPMVLYADAGETVEWTNHDPVIHSAVGAAGEWGDFSGTGEGGTVSFTFDEPGVYPYVCAQHPGMVGVVVVGDGDDASSVAAAKAAVDSEDSGIHPAIYATVGLALGAVVSGGAIGAARRIRR